MNAHMDGKVDIFHLLQTLIQVSQGSEDTQPSPASSLGIILMRLRIAEVHKESIPQELSNVTVIASNHLSTGGLIRTDHVPVVFGIELAGEFGGID